jgi:hypothetical protein
MQGVNRDIKHLTTAYQLYIYNQGADAGVNLKFKNLSCYYLSASTTTTFSYYDDFFFFTNTIASLTPTEMAIDPAVNMATVFPLKGPMSALVPKLSYSNNNSIYRNYNDKPIKTFGGYLGNGAGIDMSKGDVYFRDFLLPTGDTLENTTFHGVISSASGSTQAYSAFFGKAWGVDRNSGRRVAFSRTGGGYGVASQLMMMYNSTEFNNKLVYHIMPNPYSVKSYDIVYLDMPTGVSEIAASTYFRLKFTLGGAVSADVAVTAHLEGNNSSSSWYAKTLGLNTIQPSDGGEGTVIYSDTFTSGTIADTNSIAGAQQLVCTLELYQPSYGVAKICIDSIEIEVV